MWIVYKVTCSTGKIYVGCTAQKLNRRISQHKCDGQLFATNPQKIEVLMQTDLYEDAAQLEFEMILRYDLTNPKFGYNKKLGDNKAGSKHSEESKEKIRKKALARDSSTFEKNRTKTPEQIAKLHEGRDAYYAKNDGFWKGKHLSDESKKKISKASKGNQKWLGRKHTEETKEKLRQGVAARTPIRYCIVPDCDERYKAHDYCQKHYNQWRRGKLT